MTCNDWKAFGSHDRKSADPDDYGPRFLTDPHPIPADWEFSLERLEALRHLAMCAQSQDKNHAPQQRERAYEWVNFLISEESSKRSFFLQEHRADDAAFYDSGKPKRHSDWPAKWQEKLKWLKRPEQLSIAELEISLALFVWDSGKKPQLVWWAVQHPHILWRVDRFLYQRYCFTLLAALHKAMREKGLFKPAYRAGEFARLFPRLGAFNIAGTVIVLHTHTIYEFVWHAPTAWAIGTVLLLAVVLWFLVGMDVFRQNRGVLHRWPDAAWPRIWPLFWRSGLWALVCAAILLGMWGALWVALTFGCDDAASVRDVLPPAPAFGTLLWRTGLLALMGCVLGWVGEWIFGGEAATEPV